MQDNQVNFYLLSIEQYIDELLNHFNTKGKKATPYQQFYIDRLSQKLDTLKKWSIQ